MFYERYLQLCDSKGLKPSTAADRAGFNRGTVSVWKKKYKENIDVRPEPDVSEKICLFFNCSESWLLGIEEQKEKPVANNDDELSEAQKKLIDLTRRASDNQAEMAYRMLLTIMEGIQ